MALFAYKAVDGSGKTIKGILDAANPVDLDLRLKRLGLDLITGSPAKEGGISFGGGVARRDLITFFFHLEQLARAGVSLLESLSDLRDSMEDPRLREVTGDLIEKIEGGLRLSQAMAEHPKVFERVYVNLIKAGEQSGRLSEVLKHITETLKWQDEMAAHTKQILLYPAITGIVVIGIAFFLMIYLVPQLAGFIKTMGQDIPTQTRILMAVSSFFVKYWYAILLVPALLIAGIILMSLFNQRIRYRIDDLKLKIWPVGPILRKIIMARFATTFAMLYASGITILECVAISKDVVGNKVIEDSLTRAGREIEEGKNLSQSFQDTGMFPPLVLRMLKVGEATGALDQALLNVGYFYDRDVKESVKNLQTLIGPALTAVLGLMLGWIMLSVLGPIYDVITKVKF